MFPASYSDDSEESPEMEQDNSDDNDFQTIEAATSSEQNQMKDDNVETTVNWNEINSAADFLNLMESGNPEIDRSYGVRKYSDGTYKIGSESVDFIDGKIYVKGRPYSETPGLLQLLFRKKPDDTLISGSDIQNYRKIAEETNLLKKDFKSNRSWKVLSFNTKYSKYLKEINPAHPKTSLLKGRGLPSFMIARANESEDYKYWDDPNELVDRLRLLVAERSAGNNNHDNEIMAIIEELREAKVIF